MKDKELAFDFTGEFFVPGKSGKRIEADHMERYRFACKYAEGKSVLDIACGIGYSAPGFIEAGATSYNGVDLSDRQISHAQHTYGAESVSFSTGDICTYSNGGTFDLIICYETIEHVENYKSAFKNLYSLLSPGGILLISSPNRPITSRRALTLEDKPGNKFHTQEFTPEELRSILHEYGFTTSSDAIYGQRQRRFYRNYFVRKFVKIVCGDPDTKASPVVTLVFDKTPRYFIVVATKIDIDQTK